jgi:hypothetical protein
MQTYIMHVLNFWESQELRDSIALLVVTACFAGTGMIWG